MAVDAPMPPDAPVITTRVSVSLGRQGIPTRLVFQADMSVYEHQQAQLTV
jgi:hypothetical protein